MLWAWLAALRHKKNEEAGGEGQVRSALRRGPPAGFLGNTTSVAWCVAPSRSQKLFQSLSKGLDIININFEDHFFALIALAQIQAFQFFELCDHCDHSVGTKR